MNPEVVVALCSLAGTLGGSLIGARLTQYRIEQLEKKVEKHNNLVERMTIVEMKQDEALRDTNELFQRMREVEKGIYEDRN